MAKKFSILKVIVLSIAMLVFINGCASAPLATPAATPTTTGPLPTEVPRTLAEIETLAGFDVKEPTSLPEGAVFDYAVYKKSPHPTVISHFKLIHQTYGDLGAFFQISQEPQANAAPNPTACGVSGNDCELLHIGALAVKYRLSAPTEILMWEVDGFSFQLLRTAGIPKKIYIDDLLNVVGSMK